MIVSLIVAMTREGVIGIDNKLPWRLPDDLKRFKAITSGHSIIMGRKTFDSIGKPLPNRRNIVISRQKLLRIPGAEVFSSLDQATKNCSEVGNDEVFIIGGGEIFKEALPLAHKLYVTWIESKISGDAYFPTWKMADYRLESEEKHEAPPIPYTFSNYLRRG